MTLVQTNLSHVFYSHEDMCTFLALLKTNWSSAYFLLLYRPNRCPPFELSVKNKLMFICLTIVYTRRMSTFIILVQSKPLSHYFTLVKTNHFLSQPCTLARKAEVYNFYSLYYYFYLFGTGTKKTCIYIFLIRAKKTKPISTYLTLVHSKLTHNFFPPVQTKLNLRLPFCHSGKQNL